MARGLSAQAGCRYAVDVAEPAADAVRFPFDGFTFRGLDFRGRDVYRGLRVGTPVWHIAPADVIRKVS